MLSEELDSIQSKLGELLGKVNPECAEILRTCRRNLQAATEDAKNFEDNFYPKEIV